MACKSANSPAGAAGDSSSLSSSYLSTSNSSSSLPLGKAIKLDSGKEKSARQLVALPKILVLGAGQESIPFLDLLAEQGLQVVCLDREPNLPLAYLEQHRDSLTCIKQDFSDMAKVQEIIAKEHISHTLALPVGRALTALGCINDEYGFAGPSLAAIDIMTDKFKFHQFMQEHHLHDSIYLCLPNGRPSTLQQHLDSIEYEVGFPLVIKPVYGSGSAGVRLVSSTEELLSYQVPERFNDSPVLIEQYLIGREYSCNLFVDSSGTCHYLGVFLKEISPAPFRQEVAYFIDDVSTVVETIKPLYHELVQRLKLRNCFINADTIITAAGVPYILDIAPRLGGNNLIKLLQQDGINPIAIFKQAVLTKQTLQVPSNQQRVVLRFFNFAHTITYHQPINLASLFSEVELSHIVSYQNNLVVAESYGAMTSGRDIARGHIMVQHETIAQAEALAQRLLQALGR